MLSLNQVGDRVGASIRRAESDAARWRDSPLSRRHRSGHDDEQRHGGSLARRDESSLFSCVARVSSWEYGVVRASDRTLRCPRNAG
jgi:hypothetical protein